MNNVLTMLAAQVPMIEVRAAQAILQKALQPAAAEPESWGKVRQAFAPKTTVQNGIGVLEITGVLAYRPDIIEMFFDRFEDSAEVLTAFRRLEADPEVSSIVLAINSPGGFSVGALKSPMRCMVPGSPQWRGLAG